MLKIKNYVKVNSLEEAYELNQKKTAKILGGMVWMKMGNRNLTTAIDLSGLGLDQITENDQEFVIGCMTSLRDLETNEALNTYTGGAMRESLRHIVGVQFRNCATVGGSIYGRFGFSDVLTMFLGMDSYVELFHGGRIPLTEFVNMKKDNDILVNMIVKKGSSYSLLSESEKYEDRFSCTHLYCISGQRMPPYSHRGKTSQSHGCGGYTGAFVRL